MTLREQIAVKHEAAEKTKFVEFLLIGKIPKRMYADYLYNQYLCYRVMEEKAQKQGLLSDMPELWRADKMKEDLDELVEGDFVPQNSTIEYMNYLTSEPVNLLAHVYVRHFGDMYGGQMIKKVVPSSGKMYEFENRKEMIDKIRPMLTEDLGVEANKCFDFVIQLFNELEHEYHL
jgi:heme oxygenase